LLLLLTNKINLGAQRKKNLRTPHSKISAPKITYDDKFTVLLHKSQRVQRRFFRDVSLSCRKQNGFGTKVVNEAFAGYDFFASIPAFYFS